MNEPTPRILVVDDDPHVGAVIRAHLRSAGYRVSVARSAVQARRAPGPWALLLIDIRLPNGSVEDITRAHPGVPLVTMSGFPGARLQKPFRRAELLAAVEGVLASRKEAEMARQSLSQTLKNLPAIQARALIPPHRRKSQAVRTSAGAVIFVAGFFLPKFLGFPWQAGAAVAGFGAFMASQQLLTDYLKAIPQAIQAIVGAFKANP